MFSPVKLNHKTSIFPERGNSNRFLHSPSTVFASSSSKPRSMTIVFSNRCSRPVSLKEIADFGQHGSVSATNFKYQSLTQIQLFWLVDTVHHPSPQLLFLLNVVQASPLIVTGHVGTAKTCHCKRNVAVTRIYSIRRSCFWTQKVSL